MSGHIRTKLAEFAIYRIWASFVAFWSILLHCRQHNWHLLISGSHIQLLWGQGHARSRVQSAVSVANFSHYNFNFTAVLSLVGIIVRAKLIPGVESAPTNWLYITHHVSSSSKVIRGHMWSLTSDDLEWLNFLQGSISGCFEVFKPNLAPICSFRSTLEHPEEWR